MKKVLGTMGESVKPVLNWPAATGIIIAMVAMFSFISSNFASTADLQNEQELRLNQDLVLQQQQIQLANYIISSQNRLYREIRDSKGFALTVRRDVLQSRIDLNPSEKAELTVILTKIAELNRDQRASTFDDIPPFAFKSTSP